MKTNRRRLSCPFLKAIFQTYLLVKILKFYLVITVFLFTIFHLTNVSGSPLHIIIDPGHGGKDSGAKRGNLREADIALTISLFLKEFMQQDDIFKISLTRQDDSTLSLAERMRIVENKKADLLLSIHVNASPSSNIRGIEFYFQNQMTPSEDILFLASIENQLTTSKDRPLKPNKWKSVVRNSDVANILEDLDRNRRIFVSGHLATIFEQMAKKQNKFKSVSIHQAPFYLTSNVSVPSNLVEVGYLSNYDESKNLANPNWQKDVANCIYKALKKFALKQ